MVIGEGRRNVLVHDVGLLQPDRHLEILARPGEAVREELGVVVLVGRPGSVVRELHVAAENFAGLGLGRAMMLSFPSYRV